MSTDTRTAPEDLYGTCLDSGSVNIDWSEGGENGESRWYSVETFEYTAEGMPPVTLVARHGQVVAVFLADGTRIEDGEWQEYAEDVADDEGELPEGALTESDFEALLQVEPYQWGAEGPMMNYYYPLQESASSYNANVFGPFDARYDEIEAAYRLRDVSMCLVCLDEEDYALALTGGGMDMTWTIVRAFVLLGYLPPVKFCEAPGFDTYDQDYLVACMKESLRQEIRRTQYRLDRLTEKYPDPVQ